jgi:hypothetical protein
LAKWWLAAYLLNSSKHAHGKRARYGNAQAIIRCGEPLQLQWSGFLACDRAEQPVWRGP